MYIDTFSKFNTKGDTMLIDETMKKNKSVEGSVWSRKQLLNILMFMFCTVKGPFTISQKSEGVRIV